MAVLMSGLLNRTLRTLARPTDCEAVKKNESDPSISNKKDLDIGDAYELDQTTHFSTDF